MEYIAKQTEVSSIFVSGEHLPKLFTYVGEEKVLAQIKTAVCFDKVDAEDL
jgi:hypothetical protein